MNDKQLNRKLSMRKLIKPRFGLLKSLSYWKGLLITLSMTSQIRRKTEERYKFQY